jgi:hypothetical protein
LPGSEDELVTRKTKEATMQKVTEQAILDSATDYYLGSGDFNGLSAHQLCETFGPWEELVPYVERLIERDVLGVLSESVEMNPHIVRTDFLPKEKQSLLLQSKTLHHVCLYPRAVHLSAVVDHNQFAGMPYRLALALGAPHLSIRFFDLAILEMYRNDPRYNYDCNDIGGQISVSDEHFASDTMPTKDKVVLENFGFAYNDDFDRGVAAFVSSLAKLSPEHQQIWSAKEHSGGYRAHPNWYKSQVLGQWADSATVFAAFLYELYLINQMAKSMGRPALFRQDFGEYGEGKPKKFAFLVRPTQAEFNDFALLLDKVLSENIDKAFFQDEVLARTETKRDDGAVEVSQKGTLALLDEWIRKTFVGDNSAQWQVAIGTLREIRKLRQKPAHILNEDAFDQKYLRQQRELMEKAFGALTTLRQILQHDKAVATANISVPDWLEKGTILSV